jgi:hypothetical protein
MTLTNPQGTPGATAGTGDIVSLGTMAGGVAFVPQTTPLVRLNYFDGKFLRADDLTLEQRGQRMLVQLSNRAGGPGVVHGFNVSVTTGPKLVLSGGLGIDPAGRVLYLPETVEVPVADLLAAAQGPSPTPTGQSGSGSSAFTPCEPELIAPGANVPVIEGVQLYVVALAHAEALCGHEEVLGRLCSQGCETAEDRPYRNEGVVVLLQPLPLAGPLAPAIGGITFTDTHLRSRVASAWFAQERQGAGSWLSAPALRSTQWCQGAAALTGDVVPVGVLASKGSTVVFLDPWIVRRERMDAPPRSYWAGRMELRPWPVFLAQVLQFQCQYAGLPAAPGGGGGGGTDPCAPSKGLLDVSTQLVDALAGQLKDFGWTGESTDSGGFVLSDVVLAEFKQHALDVLTGPAAPGSGSTLIDGGIIELPPAGYLPVDPQSPTSLRAQLEPVFGSGVDLRFCAVRRDQIPHELERAQHMDRISLLRGRAAPAAVEPVDVLVPDGTTTEVTETTNPFGFAVEAAVGFAQRDPDRFITPGGRDMLAAFRDTARADVKQVPLRGVGRLHPTAPGLTAHLAAVGGGRGLRAVLRLLGTLTTDARASLNRSKRIKVSAGDVQPTELRTLAAMVTNEAVAARRKPDRTTKVLSLATGLDVEAMAVWSTCWTGGDPFTVAKGASFPISLALDAFVPGTQSALLEARLDGQAKVQERQSSGSTASVTLRITGVLSGDPVNLRDVKDLGRTVQFDVLVRRDQPAGHTRIRVSSALGKNDSWEATVTWAGAPIEADGDLREVTTGEDPTVRRLVEGHALQDPGVNQPGHEYHERAVDALTILQGAKVNDPLFLDNALRALFPAGGDTRIEVRPTTDWVLFRRRRSERCDDVVTPPPVITSKIATFVVRAANQDEAQVLATRLREGATDLPWIPAGFAEFTTGTASLVTFPSIVQQDYRDAGGGSRVAFVGYGTTIPGDPTGIGRARALLNALKPGVTLDDDNLDLLVDPPAGQMVPGTEASVFFVSYEKAPVIKDCVEVLNVDEVDQGEGAKLRDAIERADVAMVDQFASLVDPLGDVSFTAAGPNEDQALAIAVQLARIRAQHLRDDDPRFPLAVGWIAADLTDNQSVEKEGQIKSLAEKYQIELINVLSAAFDREDRCSGRLYVLQRRG